jgi:hypothetical protein
MTGDGWPGGAKGGADLPSALRRGREHADYGRGPCASGPRN